MQATLILWQRISRSHALSAHAASSSGGFAARILASTLIVLCFAGSMAAQGTGTIEGRVLNIGNNRYLNNVRIVVDGTALEVFTNAFGIYRVTNVPAGEVTVRATYTGLDPATSTVTVTAGQVAVLDFGLTSRERYGTEDVVVLDPFVVQSQREFEGDSLATNEQRFASNIKVVMASDAFGIINEGNPGEFLKYLPGVTVDYVAADVRTVSVRGFAAQFTNVYWDGMRLTSSASGSDNRIFEFEQVSINNISRSEVAKLPTPDMPSDSLGGTVNFISKNAFERKGAQFNYRLYLNANHENFDFTKTPGPKSKKSMKILPNFDFDYTLPVSDKFGIVVTGLSSNQFVEQHRWQRTYNHAQAGASPTNPYLQQWQLQDGPKTTNRASIGVKADWKVADSQVLSVAFQNNYFKTFFGNRNLNFNTGTNQVPTPATGVPLTWGADFVNSATGRATVTQGSSFRHKLGNTFATKLNYAFDDGDWNASVGISYVKARTWYRALERGHFSNIGTTLQGATTVRASGIDEDKLGWAAYTTAGAEVNPRVLANYRIGTLRHDPIDGFAIVKQARGDLGKNLDLNFPLHVQIGFDVRAEERDNRRHQNDYTFLGADGVANTADDSAGPYLDTVYKNIDPHWGYLPIEWVDPYMLAALHSSNPAYFRLGTGTAVTGVQAETFRIDNSVNIEEKVSAGYIQFTGQLFDNKLHFVTGVRYEKTENEGAGPLVDPDAIWQRNPDGTFVDSNPSPTVVARVRKVEAGATGSMEELLLTRRERAYTADREYDSFNPSLHTTFNLTDDLLIRVGYARTFGRPDYANIIPSATIDSDDNDPINNPGTITIRNTGIRPWTADNFDLSLEYYFEKSGLVSVGVFKKELTDFWGIRTGVVDAALAEELGLDERYINWGVSTTINVGDASIDGIEVNFVRPLDFLPGWGRHFTIRANGTRLSLDGPNAVDFRGFIPETGNFNIGFNKSPFSANLTWNYRGRQKNAPQTGAQYGTNTGFYEYFSPRTFVDVSGEYKFAKNMSVFVGVRNLFNKQQVLQRYNDSTPGFARSFRFEEFGVNVSIGIKGSF